MTDKNEALIDEIMGTIIDKARKKGVNVFGIDHPAIAVRESLKEWFVFAKNAPDLPAECIKEP